MSIGVWEANKEYQMDSIIEKITSYNIFTNLLPGIVFCFLLDRLYGIQIYKGDLVASFFVYYFVGMIISRVGSLLIEPVLIKLKFVTYAPYEKYLIACEKDPQIATLLETNNTYRSSLSLMFCVLGVEAWNSLMRLFSLSENYQKLVLIIGLFLLLIVSYKKQTGYIRRRIDKYSETGETGVR